ncbi:MAG: HlyC/CorC family transporter [Candidatus Obscuribacterales bacterium]|nr:HlyC/CorC family transporter [Steroidobacteraceae bacterium]
MSDIPIPGLITLIIVLIALSAFFASTETALMSLNRYRLRHLAQSGNHSARVTEKLLARPDRLIGVILLGNTIANFGAAGLTGLIALRYWGDLGFTVATIAVSILMFVFGDLAPKTYGAIHPERLALPSAWVYAFLVRLLYPIVWAANLVANAVLKLLGVSPEQTASHSLSADELRTVVAEASAVIPRRHQSMLMNILDLEKVTVDDIMIPRNEISGLDVDADWDDIIEVLRTSPHTRLPVYQGGLENVIGILHFKRVAQALAHGELTREELIEIARSREPYYVPSGTTLNAQLLSFQKLRRRIALIVNEYGDIQGLVTLEDLLEEIVGEFTNDPGMLHKDIHREPDGNYLVNGSVNVRTLNRRLGWNLPTTGPRTLNGLILEYLETIPDVGTSLLLGNYAVEILQIADNAVKTARMHAQPGALSSEGAR